MEPFEILTRIGALETGHFRLTSGRHSDKYIQCARLFEFPAYSAEFCAKLAYAFKESDERIDAVAGPAIGGIIMAYESARALGVRNLFAERENGVMTLRRGFKAAKGERVLVVEDVITTGGSVKELISLLREMGAVIAGVGSVVDRSGGKADFGVTFRSIVSMDIKTWDEEECPLCREGKPIVKPGSRDAVQ